MARAGNLYAEGPIATAGRSRHTHRVQAMGITGPILIGAFLACPVGGAAAQDRPAVPQIRPRCRRGALVHLIAGLIAILALVSAVDAQSPLDAIRARGVLRVGVKADAPPFGYVTPDGQRAGFEVELARLFARVLFDDDRRVEFVTVTTASRFPALQTGQVDLVLATITVTDERRRLAELSAPLFMSGSLLLVPRSSPVAGLGDLAGRRVAVVRGSVHERDLAEFQPGATAGPVGSVAEGAQAVRRGHAAAFLYDDVVLLGLAQGDATLRVAGKPIRPRPYAVAAPRGEVELIHWVNRWLAKIRRDGTYDEIWRRYFEAFEWRLVKG